MALLKMPPKAIPSGLHMHAPTYMHTPIDTHEHTLFSKDHPPVIRDHILHGTKRLADAVTVPQADFVACPPPLPRVFTLFCLQCWGFNSELLAASQVPCNKLRARRPIILKRILYGGNGQGNGLTLGSSNSNVAFS